MQQALVIENLTKRYKDFTLDHISFSLPQGTILGIIGENGSGKSTLINALLGLIPADYSQLELLGKDIAAHPNLIKQDLAVIFDDAGYDENFTPLQIGKFLSHVYKNWDADSYRSYLKRFDLPAKKRLKTFSRGMKTKLEFAIAFSHSPKFLIMDEATNGLDPVFRDEILDLLREFSEEENHTVLIASHITSDLDKIADYVAYIHHGRLLFFQSYDELQNEYGIINCKKSFLDNLNPEDVVYYRKEDYSYRVLVKNRYSLKQIFQDVEIHSADLEEIMLFYAKGEKLE
ncbi:ABC transporter ATP-binding protein [Sellimonas catena]|uniref:ABC transporter n=1 Tax=Sellimonas catena TaxID=2994035 RepID=A0A9W6CBG0_9FIRM|nr:ABC transporter ATP-binding protein [Sellimonas catena]GLG04551.1 ABC transporter [Sellimonas catena]GLG88735.1 ABC transporter [Sellimonas catena]